ncbi:MAG TPA: histidine kinase [Candidatus Dormibacteraeota bacterium]|nr:histidine kinase [Candidatus Dormibacteraeota bacterium]
MGLEKASIPIAAFSWLLSATLAITAIAFSLSTRATSVNGLSVPSPAQAIIISAGALSFATVGGLILILRPNRIGWFMAVAGVTFLVADDWAVQYLGYSVANHRGLPALEWAGWLNAWVWIPNFSILLIALPLLFPNGRLPSHRWRPIAAASIGLVIVMSAFAALSPDFVHYDRIGLHNPLAGGISALSMTRVGWLILGYPLLVACAVAAAVSLVIRYRDADAVVKQQLKWVTLSVVLIAIAIPISAFKEPFVLAYAPQIALLTLPPAIGIAVFRYRLYDVDLVVSRTLVYGAVAALLTAIYLLIVVGIGALVGGTAQHNLLLSVVATALVALVFQPVRERTQRLANRLVYGRRSSPYEVLAQLSDEVGRSVATDLLLVGIARACIEGTGAASAEVWLRQGPSMTMAAAWPSATTGPTSVPVAVDAGDLSALGADRVLPVRQGSNLAGALAIHLRPGHGLRPLEEKVLGDVAQQAALVFSNLDLSTELRRRLEELQSSRQRLVQAQDQERRRLERNLHDGAQQHLVALKVQARLLKATIDRDPARAKSLADELAATAGDALDELRDLARGIYPPLLAESGLARALEAQSARATVPVTIDADGVGRHQPEIEAAVYFSCLEALQNVQKYAEARAVSVLLRMSGGRLMFQVRDNGKGFDPATTKRGAGLQNIQDRLDALGGGIEIRSSPGEGTLVSGWLPV